MSNAVDPGALAPDVIVFTQYILRSLGYELGPSYLQSYYVLGDFPTSCMTAKVVSTNLSLLGFHPSRAASFVAEIKQGSSTIDSEPQMVAKAIVVFHILQKSNNSLQEIVLPCISMRGTFPTFYKIRVTRTLVDAVRAGRKPREDTECIRYVPELPGPRDQGMIPLPNRLHLLKDLLAFWAIIRDFEAQVEEGERVQGE